MRLMKVELSGKIMEGFIPLRLYTYSYLTDEGHVDKKTNCRKSCVIKRKIRCQDYKEYLEIKNLYQFRSEGHNLFTEKLNKIAIIADDDKRIQASDGVTTD